MRGPPGYRVLARIATGGMAEIFLAQRLGVEGVSKAVVLKRIRADLAGDPEFVRMLLDEARLAVDLSHANITAVFELGRDDGSHFLSMEYVRGWDLARVLGACARATSPMPVAVALHVAAEVAKALAYAHERRDARGEPLGIVHRDVSPPNVLLSTEGEVKLADFGIARAAAKASTTSPSWIKGKLPYMSPEQASGASVDARSDLFSLGILMFEMLTARRLFRGNSDAALLAAVRGAAAPAPSTVRAGVPPAVDALVAASLARDPATRFQTARAMHAAIRDALRSVDPDAGGEAVVAFLGQLDLPPPPDPAELAAAPESVDLVAPALPAPLSEAPPAPAPAAPATVSAAPPAPVDRARLAGRGQGGIAGGGSERSERSPPIIRELPGRPPSRLVWVAPLCALLAFGAGALARDRSATARVEVRSTTPGVIVSIDGVRRGVAPLTVVGLPRGAVEVRLEKDGFAPFVHRVDLGVAPDVVVDAALDPLR